MRSRRIFRATDRALSLRPGCFLALGLIIVLNGCSTVTISHPDGTLQTHSRNDFEVYAEDVFRRQNHAGSELVFVYTDLDTVDQDEYHQLVRAEERMLFACEPVNQMALHKMRDTRPGLFLKIRFMNSVVHCDQAATRLELLLQRYEYAHGLEGTNAQLTTP